eukprot:26554-Pyramimonas_sp.AAC.1
MERHRCACGFAHSGPGPLLVPPKHHPLKPNVRNHGAPGLRARTKCASSIQLLNRSTSLLRSF